KIYVKAYNSVKDKVTVKGMAHITGGGIPGNLPRVFPKGFGAKIEERSWPVLPIFTVMQRLGNVPYEDMKRTFNMGIGFAMVVDKAETDKTIALLKKAGYKAYRIGSIEKGIEGVHYV
ncbi:MAG: AIR synthase-related protein, partial [Nitrospirota bacterium]|nr:AIR synthase-related protein [Nitrospirota bacterium]